MNDLQSAAALAGSLKPAVDLAQSVLNLIGTGKGREEALKLYGQVYAAHQDALAAQTAQMALLKEKHELEQQLAKFKDWEAEKNRYVLKKVDSHSVAFGLKPGMENGEAAHWLCTGCFANGEKGYLQLQGEGGWTSGSHTLLWRCNRCGATLKIAATSSP